MESPTDKSLTGIQTRQKEEAKEAKISQDQNYEILVIKTRTHRMLKDSKSQVMIKR
jgi:hypothetical protein